jgi:hypothetical protein
MNDHFSISKTTADRQTLIIPPRQGWIVGGEIRNICHSGEKQESDKKRNSEAKRNNCRIKGNATNPMKSLTLPSSLYKEF